MGEEKETRERFWKETRGNRNSTHSRAGSSPLRSPAAAAPGPARLPVGAAGAAWPPRGTRPPDAARVAAPGFQRAGCHAPAHPPGPAKGFAASGGAGPV